MKTRYATTFMLATMGLSGAVLAQQTNEQYYQEQQQQQQQVLNAEQQRSGYLHSQDQQQPQQPSGHWEKTWGAIAIDDTKGVLGTSVGVNDESMAQSLALRDCEAKGGGGCQVNLTYLNQCAAVVLGDKGHATTHAATVEQASSIGLNECGRNDSNCNVYYTACSEPKFIRY